MQKNQLHSASRRQALVAALQANGAIRDPGMAQAFLTVPRECFLTCFYERSGQAWVLSQDDGSEQWLGLLYADDALVTRIEQQRPISSSSQPSIMARMLDALQVQPGQRILEVGTGTGYNAALLAHLTGDPGLVTTIDIAADIVDQAKLVLREPIGPITVSCGDGCQGAPEQAPFDRIMITASSSGIAHAWYDQLAPGGRLVMPLEGSLQAGGFFIAEKGQHHAIGHFRLAEPFFLPLRSASAAGKDPEARELFQLPSKGVVNADEAHDPLIEALVRRDFRWFLQWAWPPDGVLQILQMTLPDKRNAIQLKDARQGTILQLAQEPSGNWSGQQRGDFPLWQRVRRFFRRYQELHCPGKQAYQVQLNDAQALLSVVDAERSFDLRDLYFAPGTR